MKTLLMSGTYERVMGYLESTQERNAPVTVNIFKARVLAMTCAMSDRDPVLLDIMQWLTIALCTGT
jgi:hypothetical protein